MFFSCSLPSHSMLTDEHRAEHVGFEPTDAVTRINALAVRPNRPLWQCSARHSTGFIRHLQRRGQPIYGLTCPMRSRRGSNPLIPFRGLTCVPSMRLTVRPLLPVGRAVAPVEDVCRARPSFRSVLSLSIRGMRSVAICPLRSRRESNPLIPSSGTRRFSRPVPYRSATAPRQAYRRPSRRFEAISPLDVRSAESLGFEPREPLTRFNGFQDRRIQPLCHDSAERTPHQAASSYYMRLSMYRQWGISRFFPSSRHSARCACPGSNRDPGLITGTRTSTSRVCQFRHKRAEPNDCM